MESQSKIYDTLDHLNLIRKDTIEIFSNHTRDNKNLTVYRDSNSGVIFINEYYVGKEEYESGEYRKSHLTETTEDFEDIIDTERRYNKYKQFIIGKNICDFGCGAGNFLRLSSLAKSKIGIEIQKDFKNILNKEKIKCVSSLESVGLMDTVFLFHTLEHLPDPIKTLKDIHTKLKPNGKIIIEVPHARDFLLTQLKNESFKNSTLWSQHLILHTRESLYSFLNSTGFKDIHIEGIQRYGLSNHMSWLKDGKSGGHKNNLSIFETENLKNAYADALSRLDANDTIVATATV
jgi:2-polyprenyl-3-methyl-5-hydroxy-6-metoxy-1,4-benzoquinol methylase